MERGDFMEARDLTGMQVGTLTVIRFDEERHNKDLAEYKAKKRSRVKRFWICKCSKCGQERSVDASNLVSGNTKGCMCDKFERSGAKLKRYNKFEYDSENKCYKLYASNTNNVFLIDESDYESVKEHCWYENNYGYLITRLDEKTQILLHRFLMFGIESEFEKNVLVDHKSRDKQDNRRSNLRIANYVENARNTSITSMNTSGYVGVSEYIPNQKWRAYITVNKKFISLGYYDNIDDAVAARKEAEIKYFGEFIPA